MEVFGALTNPGVTPWPSEANEVAVCDRVGGWLNYYLMPRPLLSVYMAVMEGEAMKTRMDAGSGR